MAAAALLRRGVCRTASAARTPVAARAPASQARWARPLATTPATLSPGEDLGSFDYGFSKDRIEKGNVSGAAENRGFTYLLMGANKFIYASAVRIGALKFIATMSATKDVLALASAEFDVSAVEEGQTITVRVSVDISIAARDASMAYELPPQLDAVFAAGSRARPTPPPRHRRDAVATPLTHPQNTGQVAREAGFYSS
jgi:hypothetical protein